MKKKTIILLSAKRCGTTAVANVFRKSSEIKVCGDDQKIDNLEINFWNNAYYEFKKKPNDLKKNLIKYMPSIFENKEIKINTKKDIFDLWNFILEKKGPIIFDKSPKYLENMSFLNLISDYRKNHEVKIIGMIRNPLDAITSQYELWHEYTNEQDLIDREIKWLTYYSNLENFLKLEKMLNL